MAKVIKCYLDDFKSVDPNYEGQKFYHYGEKVKIINPDHENFKDAGIYQGYEKKDYPAYIYLIEIKN